MSRAIQLPMSRELGEQLRAGEEVSLCGTVLTARDQACARLFGLLQEDKPLPVDMEGQVIYFVGPTPAPPGRVIGAAGPTTSGRMNPFMPEFLSRGLRGFIGKGYLSDPVKQALMQHGGVYFGAIGGTGALLSAAIAEAKVIAFDDLLTEAVRKLVLRNFPAVVLNDSVGGDLYARAKGEKTCSQSDS